MSLVPGQNQTPNGMLTVCFLKVSPSPQFTSLQDQNYPLGRRCQGGSGKAGRGTDGSRRNWSHSRCLSHNNINKTCVAKVITFRSKGKAASHPQLSPGQCFPGHYNVNVALTLASQLRGQTELLWHQFVLLWEISQWWFPEILVCKHS